MTQPIPRSLAPFALLLAVGFLGAASPSVPKAPEATEGTTIILVRHAERVAPNGDLPLSEAGRERAALLAHMLGNTGITHVFTSEMVRTRETAAPLATRLGLTPVTVPVAQSDLLVARLDELPGGAVALVVNHGGTIPGIIQKLGARAPAPIGEDEFDHLFAVTRTAGGRASVIEMRYGKPPENATSQRQ
jgi:broad specificity phosphatase PhoE